MTRDRDEVATNVLVVLAFVAVLAAILGLLWLGDSARAALHFSHMNGFAYLLAYAVSLAAFFGGMSWALRFSLLKGQPVEQLKFLCGLGAMALGVVLARAVGVA